MKTRIKNFGLHSKSVNKGTQGFTLVETLIYVSLFAVLSVFLINSLLIMMSSYTTVRANNDILDAAHNSYERLSREIRSAQSIDNIVSVFGVNPGILKLNTTDSSGSSITEQFNLNSGTGNLEFTNNGTLVGDLNGGHVEITSLIFRKITTAVGSAVKIEMTIQSGRMPSLSMDFTDTIVLRGDY